MQVVCHPCKLSGEIAAIPSKSDAHRVLICAALSDKKTVVKMNTKLADDIRATLDCLEALGASFQFFKDRIVVTPITKLAENPVLDCKESGATLRFLLPLVAALGCGGTFKGSGRLPSRPIQPIIDELRNNGIVIDNNTLPLTITGQLSSTQYQLPGNISSQFITGFLFALSVIGGGTITITETLESAPYVDMTLSTLHQFGIHAKKTSNEFIIPQQSKFASPSQVVIEGDWSNMSFFLSAGALGGPIVCTNLSTRTQQGDSAITQLLEQFGARVRIDANTITTQHNLLNSIQVDVKEIPDLVPILAVVASVSIGTTIITGASRLRIKESNRLTSVTNMINRLGGNIEEGSDHLIIHGVRKLQGGEIDCAGDHRIVMAGAIASIFCKEPVVLEGAEAVNKSYPHFFEDFKSLGGIINVINNG